MKWRHTRVASKCDEIAFSKEENREKMKKFNEKFDEKLMKNSSTRSFWFLSFISARPRRVLANREERIEKIIGTAFFLAGRSWRNFDAFPYCKCYQTRLDHKSAKSARTGLRF